MLSRLLAERWDALDLEGPVIKVDTEREVAGDIDGLLHRIHLAAEALR
jgi:hypothetical protein